MKTIVAFLQNSWYRKPETARRILARYEKNGDDRSDFVRDFLFLNCENGGGCTTGKNLLKAFGDELCDLIIWEEISPEIGGKSSAKFPPDSAHIRRVLEKWKPGLVVCFGQVAGEGLWDALRSLPADDYAIGNTLYAPHPAARHATVMANLKDTAAQVRAWLEKQEAKQP